MNIEFISVCHNFQRRMSWFLASLVQQTYLPDVIINLAYVRTGASPDTELIMSRYKRLGIKFRGIGFDSIDDIAYRGALRNAQIAVSRAEWLFFYDVDQVLSPDFFEKWKEKLNDAPCIFYEQQKLFTDPTETQKMTEAQGQETYFKNAYAEVDKLTKITVQHNNVASGGLMMIRREHLFEVTKGLYSDSFRRKDRHIYKQRTTSDPVFRAKFKVKGYALSPVIHLGHASWQDYKAGRFVQQ